MNERINELFGQALDQAVPETWTTLNPAQLSKLKEKFADLIVQECIHVVEGTNDRYRRDYFAGKIREHFGIDN